jgi:hypothetical protein
LDFLLLINLHIGHLPAIMFSEKPLTTMDDSFTMVFSVSQLPEVLRGT